MKLAKDCPTLTCVRMASGWGPLGNGQGRGRGGARRGEARRDEEFLGLPGLFVVHCNQLNNVAY